MRRSTTVLLLWSLLVPTALIAGPTGAQEGSDAVASDLPAGFTDGEVVGGTDVPAGGEPSEAEAGFEAGATEPGAAPRATRSSTRYFGQGPWDAINEAAAATPRCPQLSAATLTALVVSPIFKESSAATSPSTAPSPMTLSRYDEWNGIYATTSNASANYGLYAFRDPYTTYSRAYWHPGIGIWQYDSAGVGAPFTAIERMNVRIVGGDVAAGMAARYCNPPTSIVGHGAPFTDQERRDAAWWPWWTGNTNRECPLCQVEFDLLTASTPYFANVSRVAGISATGGAVKRSCTLAGVAGTHECWYIDPSVGVIEGATGWATLLPAGGSPTSPPAPLSRPFYVIKRDGKEERHWLRADTGYDSDVAGTRLLGRNARPRSNQAGSGITWTRSSGLCDRTASRGNCGLIPTPPTNPMPVPADVPMTSTATTVGGTFRSVTLDATGDGRGDVLWYAPGAGADHLWIGRGAGQFASVRLSIGGAFDDVVPLDANGDGRNDLLFSNRTTGSAYLWLSKGNGTFTSLRVFPGTGRQPLVLDVDGRGGDEVFWYGPGRVGDALWTWQGSSFSARAVTVDGTFQPFVGDFDRNGTDDIFWYGPGSAADRLWLHRSAGGHVSKVISVGGPYEPVVGDFDGNGGTDVLWYGVGTTTDTVWFSGTAGSFSPQSLVVNQSYEPVVVDLDGDGRDDVLWHAPGTPSDLWTRWTATRSRNSVSVTLTGPHQAIVGRFSTGGADGILWYAAGPVVDVVWWR